MTKQFATIAFMVHVRVITSTLNTILLHLQSLSWLWARQCWEYIVIVPRLHPAVTAYNSEYGLVHNLNWVVYLSAGILELRSLARRVKVPTLCMYLASRGWLSYTPSIEYICWWNNTPFLLWKIMPSVNYITHLAENVYQAVPTLCCKWWKTGREVGTSPTCTHISTWCIICETHTTSVHMQSKSVCMGTFLEPIA